MALKIIHKEDKKKDKSKEQKKQAKKEKSEICENYRDRTDFNVAFAQIEMTKLRYGIIESCYVDAIYTPDGNIKIDKSWIGLIILMLDTVIKRNPNDLDKMLTKYDIASEFFVVDKYYGKYSFDADKVYKAYNIFNSGYYVESTFSCECIFKALVGLTRCLGYKLKDIKIDVRNDNVANSDIDFSKVSSNETICNIKNVLDNLKKNMKIIAINIFDESTRVSNIITSYMIFCIYMCSNYELVKILDIENVNNTGLSLDNTDNKNYTLIPGTSIFAYTDNNEQDIIQFMINAMSVLGMSAKDVTFKMESLDENIDWENRHKYIELGIK